MPKSTNNQNKVDNSFEDEIKEYNLSDEQKKFIKKSLFLHLTSGVLILTGMFILQSIITGIDISIKRFFLPNLVGVTAAFFIWKNKTKVLKANFALEKIIEKRTLDLRVANEMLEEIYKKSNNL